MPKEKDKKGGKKDSKDPKKVEEPQEPDNTITKTIETFKTWRQKSVFTSRNESYESFKKDYNHHLSTTLELIEKGLK